ncbi:MAG TPA: acyl-CoA synthetase [Burkholderiales bacterium]|nr:acyl-CoA synthetase [Burkholderiales bacterium]
MARLSLGLGRGLTRCLLPPLCLYYYATAPRARRASREFLARALGREPRLRDALRHYHAFASTMHDRLLLAAGHHAALDIAVSGAEQIDRLLAAGRGCLLVGSHLGSFEVLRALERTSVHRVSVVMHEENARRMQALISRLAPGLQQRVIASGRPDTMLRIKERLERGGIVGILGDRPLSEERTASRDFLGAPARFPLGPWLLAATLGCPVGLFFGLYRGGARYEIELETFSEGERVPRQERDAAAASALARFVARLEHHARRAPDNWFNFYDFWEAGRA